MDWLIRRWLLLHHLEKLQKKWNKNPDKLGIFHQKQKFLESKYLILTNYDRTCLLYRKHLKTTHCQRNYPWTMAASRTFCSPCLTVIYVQICRFHSNSIDILHLCHCIEWNCCPVDGMLANQNFVLAGYRSMVVRACREMLLLAVIVLLADWKL